MSSTLEATIAEVLDSLSLELGDRLLVAVSGGGDSMALLRGLLSLQEQYGYLLTVAHFDHLSREGQSTVERLAVEDYALAHGCGFLWQSAEVETVARERKQSFELCARELRYAFFYQCMERLQAKFLLTAHQAEDNIETLLYRLCRGTGLQGLSGIPPKEGVLLRPLLRVSRGEIAEYLERHSIPHWTDESNFDTRYRRNFIRHELLPLLEELNPQYVGHISNTMSIIREENSFLDTLVAEQVSLVAERNGHSCKVEDLLSLPLALQHRGLQRLVTAVDRDFRLSTVQGQQVLALAKKTQPSLELLCCKHLHIEKIYDRMYCSSALNATTTIEGQTERKVEKTLELCPNRQYFWGKFQISVEIVSSSAVELSKDLQNSGGKWLGLMRVNADKIFVRSRAVGDEITLPKRPRKTLKKLMIEEKIPRMQRDLLPVFCLSLNQSQNQVLAVCGLGVAEDVQPTEAYQGQLWQVEVVEKSM